MSFQYFQSIGDLAPKKEKTFDMTPWNLKSWSLKLWFWGIPCISTVWTKIGSFSLQRPYMKCLGHVFLIYSGNSARLITWQSPAIVWCDVKHASVARSRNSKCWILQSEVCASADYTSTSSCLFNVPWCRQYYFMYGNVSNSNFEGLEKLERSCRIRRGRWSVSGKRHIHAFSTSRPLPRDLCDIIAEILVSHEFSLCTYNRAVRPSLLLADDTFMWFFSWVGLYLAAWSA